jgi:hypothetical protein
VVFHQRVSSGSATSRAVRAPGAADASRLATTPAARSSIAQDQAIGRPTTPASVAVATRGTHPSQSGSFQ